MPDARDQQRRGVRLVAFGERGSRRFPHLRVRIVQNGHQRADHGRAGVFLQRLGSGGAHLRGRIGEARDQQVRRFRLRGFGERQHRHPPHPRIVAACAQREVFEIAWFGIEQGHGQRNR